MNPWPIGLGRGASPKADRNKVWELALDCRGERGRKSDLKCQSNENHKEAAIVIATRVRQSRSQEAKVWAIPKQQPRAKTPAATKSQETTKHRKCDWCSPGNRI